MHVLIIGAGPAGLATALALNQQSTATLPIQITVLELRGTVQTLGGAVNLTPLALRYLDSLGVGERLRPLGVKVGSIQLVSLRTGRTLGNLWPDADAIRVQRHDVVQTMMHAVQALPAGRVSVRFGIKVESIEEYGSPDGDGGVKVHFKESNSGKQEEVKCDVLLGCDGLHSIVRGTVVEPGRGEVYSGKATAYGYVRAASPGDADLTLANGGPTLKDSTLVTAQRGSFLMSFFEPSREHIFLASVSSEKEQPDAREGWKAMGADKEAIKLRIAQQFQGGKLKGLDQLLHRCEDWFFYPVYMLPPDGIWSKGRVLLLGDAAHAMPPQGESTGVAIEDGVLFAHVFSRLESRTVPEMFADYESLRRADIRKVYADTMFRWDGAGGSSWAWSIVMEWISGIYITMMNRGHKDHFARDVRKFQLPS